MSAANSEPVSAATDAPNAKLISFSQLTGMPIASAASGSSRCDRQARPGAREVHEAERDEDDDEEGERDVEVGDGEDAAVLDGEVVAEEVERVDAAGSRSARR